ncbi:DUF1868 domain-containing protein [Roseobacter sp.]|uniref:DUF1868 domain-containing protein n=1 Tax=Roseobacter sp. TaxID=1907202 RepID=UPI00329A10C6
MTTHCDIAPFAARNNTQPPVRLGQRYDAHRFLPEAGNTVVCHLDRTAPTHSAVLRARAQMMALPGASGFLFTPEDSLHMTLFEGVLDTRRTQDAWPRDLDLSAPVTETTNVLQRRLAGFSPLRTFTMRAVGLLPTGLTLAGSDDSNDEIARLWRDALTEPFGYRHHDHDAYRFHISFAYPVTWLSDSALPVWKAEIPQILGELVETTPTLPLCAPAFCTFSDMCHFKETLGLGG